MSDPAEDKVLKALCDAVHAIADNADGKKLSAVIAFYEGLLDQPEALGSNAESSRKRRSNSSAKGRPKPAAKPFIYSADVNATVGRFTRAPDTYPVPFDRIQPAALLERMIANKAIEGSTTLDDLSKYLSKSKDAYDWGSDGSLVHKSLLNLLKVPALKLKQG